MEATSYTNYATKSKIRCSILNPNSIVGTKIVMEMLQLELHAV